MVNRLVELFLELSRIYSPTGDEDRLANYIIKTLDGKADRIRKDSYGNVYASKKGLGEPLFFAAHMDNVQPCKGTNPKLHNGYIKSDGTTTIGADNKAAIAALLYALENFYKRRPKHRAIELVFTRSEEVGNLGALNFDYKLLNSGRGFCFDSANKDVGLIVRSSPFYERFDINAIGRASHAARPEKGINALLGSAEFINRIKLGRRRNGTLVNIGVMKAGSARNAVPGFAELNGEIRSLEMKNIESCKKSLAGAMARAREASGAVFKSKFTTENPGYVHKRGTAAWKLMEYARRRISGAGLKPKLIDSFGVSDANIFNNRGIACLNISNGVENAHTKDERIKLSSLEKLHAIIESLATGDSSSE